MKRLFMFVAGALGSLGIGSPAMAVSVLLSTDKINYAVGENVVVTVQADTSGAAADISVFMDVSYSPASLVSVPLPATQDVITSFGGALHWAAANPLCGPSLCTILNQLAGTTPLVPDPAVIVGTLVIPTIAEGTLTISPNIVAFFGAAAPNPISVTIGPGGGGGPALVATKSDEQLTDDDMDGAVDGGDEIQYTVVITNVGDADAQNVLFTDTPDANAPLIDGSVVPTQGNVTSGNGGEGIVGVDLGTIPPGESATVVFDVAVVSPVPDGVMSVSNQGSAQATGVAPVLTDDPDTGSLDDPTVTDVQSALETCREDVAACDADLGSCDAELGTCGSDLSTCEAALAAVTDDTDHDGLPDPYDTCPGTPAGESIDASGCSLAQFCGGFNVASTSPNALCNQADWQNDEPLGAADCMARAGACEPR